MLCRSNGRSVIKCWFEVQKSAQNFSRDRELSLGVEVRDRMVDCYFCRFWRYARRRRLRMYGGNKTAVPSEVPVTLLVLYDSHKSKVLVGAGQNAKVLAG